jgi:hypothetical protein
MENALSHPTPAEPSLDLDRLLFDLEYRRQMKELLNRNLKARNASETPRHLSN